MRTPWLVTSGLPLGDTGFVNLSLEYGNADPTNRSVQRADAAALIAAGNTDVADPGADLGQPDDRGRAEAVRQLRPPVRQPGLSSFTATPTMPEKKVTEGFYFRNPNTRANIYSLDDGETLLIGDRARRARYRHARTARLTVPTVRVMGQRAGRRRRSRPGVCRPELLLLSGAGHSGRVHAAVRRRGQRQRRWWPACARLAGRTA